MKAKALLYAAVAAMACLSCTREAEESGVLDTGIELAFTAEWVNENGTDSRTVLQDDGTYWSLSLYSVNQRYAYCVYFDSEDLVNGRSYYRRYRGLSVRPVTE